MEKHLVALTGAGISAESGVPTFRDTDGLWMGYDINVVASIDGWRRDPATVLEFYNLRRREALKAQPNEAHKILAKLEEDFKVTVITQNVDDLHERAGSTNVIHLHGELMKMHSDKCTDTTTPSVLRDITEDIHIGDLAEDGGQLRPFVVWFGEMVPMLEKAIHVLSGADIFLVVGTSLQVYPAASLIHYVPDDVPKYIIDKHPPQIPFGYEFNVIQKGASEGMQDLSATLYQ